MAELKLRKNEKGMILAIDMGNTNIVIGCVDDKKVLFEERLSTDYYCWSFDGVFTRPFNFFTLSTDKKSFFNFNTVKIKIKF